MISSLSKYDEISNQYICNTSTEHKKKFAQYFTPETISNFMLSWIITKDGYMKILDPAFGLGVFAKNAIEINDKVEYFGYEVDKLIFQYASEIFSGITNVKIKNTDFLENDWNNKYDGIICNPPYLKFHNYDNIENINKINNKFNIFLSGLTNIYGLFLIKALTQLEINGRLAFILPSEFLNSNYGTSIKKFLIDSGTLRYIIVFDKAVEIFANVITTNSILLCSNDSHDKRVKFFYINSLENLDLCKKEISKYPNFKMNDSAYNQMDILPEVKWHNYYQKDNGIINNNLVPVSMFMQVKRGIATGSNDYFLFSKSKKNKLDIPAEYFLPCISKSIHVKTPIFTIDDYHEIYNSDKNTLLFNALNLKNRQVIDYVNFGEKIGVDKLYLTSRRKPWFSLEKREPSPIWVSVFNRNGLKFIKNEANIYNLTTFHSVYLKSIFIHKSDIIFAYLITELAKRIFEKNKREYGNGLQKFEPNDLNNALMLDLRKLDISTENRILEELDLLRNSMFSERLTIDSLNRLNSIFIEYFL
ncbi:MAG TPA: N-6 DNA methylase [Melioribacteraceae bacterium]|mgnify:CR=1 FL=1|nr:N-6 DNA methylase [Melioribacteraceae bacterium]